MHDQKDLKACADVFAMAIRQLAIAEVLAEELSKFRGDSLSRTLQQSIKYVRSYGNTVYNDLSSEITGLESGDSCG